MSFDRPPARVLVFVSQMSLALGACSGSPKPATGGGGAGGSSSSAGTSGSAGGGGNATGGSSGGTTGAAGTAGTAGATGAAGTTGGAGNGGTAGGAAGASGAGGQGNTDAGSDTAAPAPDARDATAGEVATARFSFFETSLVAMRRLSKSQNGFGGDLRYGAADGLAGADKICTEIAEFSNAGAGAKGWRAFLSAASGPGGQPVNGIDRLGNGPWYDRLGRIVAMNKAALLNARPMGADSAIINDLPNEDGVPNHQPDPGMPAVDNHHVLTGSNDQGQLYSATATCASWTSTAVASGRPRIGFSWPLSNRVNWISGQDEGGCGAGVLLNGTGGSDPNNPIVGSGGGYGGIYCFANVP